MMERSALAALQAFNVEVCKLTFKKVTEEVRVIRRAELGDNSEYWVERLEPILVLEGDPKQLADWRS